MSLKATVKQQRLLSIIKEHIAATGVAPSYREMCSAMGVNSIASVHRMLFSLEDRGLIRRLPYRARAIEVVDSSVADALDILTQQSDLPAELRTALVLYAKSRRGHENS